MRLALAWLAGTAMFALGLVLADRWFWAQCSGLASTRYAEVWICANSPYVRLALVCLAGFAAGLLARRRGIAMGALAALAGLVLVTLAYRPPVAILPISALLGGVAWLVAPAMIGAVAGAKMQGASWRTAL